MTYLMIIIVSSFFLEGFFSLFISMNSYFFPLFTLVSLVVAYPYFRKYGHTFEMTSLVVGLCYDMVYTNTVFLHALLFLVISYILKHLYHYFENKYWNIILIIFISLVIYCVLNFCLMFVIGRIVFSITNLICAIVGSLISNIIYGTILYGLLHFLKNHNRIQIYH